MNTLDWLGRLVAIDTTSRNSNLGLIETVRDALTAQGLKPWLAANADGSKANLFCTLPAADGQHLSLQAVLARYAGPLKARAETVSFERARSHLQAPPKRQKRRRGE